MSPLFCSYFMGGAFVRDLPQFRQQNFEPLWLKCPILGNHAILIPLLNYLNSKYQFTLLQPFLIMYNHSAFFCCPWRIKYGKWSYINDVRFVWVLTTLGIIRCPGNKKFETFSIIWRKIRDKCAVHVIFELLQLVSNVKIVVKLWMFIYFLLFR